MNLSKSSTKQRSIRTLNNSRDNAAFTSYFWLMKSFQINWSESGEAKGGGGTSPSEKKLTSASFAWIPGANIRHATNVPTKSMPAYITVVVNELRVVGHAAQQSEHAVLPKQHAAYKYTGDFADIFILLLTDDCTQWYFRHAHKAVPASESCLEL